MEKGAATLKRVFLELGGKSAMIVLDDADFASRGADGGHRVHARRSGVCDADRGCCCRVSRYDEGVELVTAAMSQIPYGDPQRHGERDGPADQRASSATACSATSQRVSRRAPHLALGGGRPAHLDKGWYVEPTLFTDVDNSMTIAHEEIFGPVLAVIPYRRRRRRRAHRQRERLRVVGRRLLG